MTPTQVVYFVGGVLLVLLATVVVALRWRSPLALAFAGFAFLPGVGALEGAAGLHNTPRVYLWLLGALGTAAFWGLFVLFPRKLGRDDRWIAIAAGVFGVLVGVLATVANLQQGVIGAAGSQTWDAAGDFVGFAVSVGVYSGLPAFIVLLPLRMLRVGKQGSDAARSIGIVAVGLALFTCGTFGDFAAVARGVQLPLWGALDAAFILAPVLLWSFATRSDHPAVARNVVLVSTAIWLASYLLGSQLAWAMGSILGALLLGYAVLRGMIPGLDLKVRFALKTSTVAALFLAVLFVVANIAQNFLGGKFGVVVGGAAAGMLFFVMAPIQRVAERLAEKAVPALGAAEAAQTTQERPLARRESTYREALRLALRDRQVTPRERVHLFRLADDLGIAAARAAELQNEVEEAVPHGA